MEGEGLSRGDLVSLFTWPDYLVFCAMLAMSAGIGVYYGFFQKVTGRADFFIASRSMGTLPVALSLTASFISAITMIGTTTEIYQNGFEFWLLRANWFLVAPVAAYVYLPPFWRMKVSSANEYLGLRFNYAVRLLGSSLFLFQMTLYLAIAVYAPSLALSQVTGIPVIASVSSVFCVCIFYSTLGGIKAVLWTDVLQIIVMISSMILVMIKGVIDEGGVQEVWRKASEGNRTTLASWEMDPRERHTFWGLFIGGFFLACTLFCTNLTHVQRYLCVKSKKSADNAIWLSAFGFWSITMLSCLVGLIMYAKYADCDPVSSNLVSKPDQMLPLMAMDSLGHFPGLAGVFVAGIFSGALSSVSSGINSLSMIVMEDFIHGKYGCVGLSDKMDTTISKCVTLGFGVLAFGLVFLVQEMGDIMMLGNILFSLIGGPTLGLFSLGMLVPCCNSLGAILGTLMSLAFVLWISGGNVVAISRGQLIPERLPVTPCNFTDGLTLNLSELATTATPLQSAEDDVLEIYKISYMWYSICGIFGAIFAGTLISVVTGKQDIRTLNPDLISPVVFKLKRIFPSISKIGIHFNNSNEEAKTAQQMTHF